MKSATLAAAFLILVNCVESNVMRTPTAHAQAPKQSPLVLDAEVVPRSELVEEIKPGDWIPNFKGTMRAVSLSCVPSEHEVKCYVLLQSR